MTVGNRHLFGDIDGIQATIRSSVEVKPGDLMFQNSTAKTMNTGLANAKATADNYAYPLAAGATQTSKYATIAAAFLGIAMDDSPNGTTTTITIATAGAFRFPLKAKGAVTLGATVSGVTPISGFSATAQTTASWQVIIVTGSAAIGYCIRTQSGASYVDFELRTKTGPGGVI